MFVQKVGRVPGTPFYEFSGERCAEVDGFTLHANVRIDGRKRKRLERLLRYMARPAVAGGFGLLFFVCVKPIRNLACGVKQGKREPA